MYSPTMVDMRKVYKEFGIDIHSVPLALQGPINKIVVALIKARKKVDKDK